MLKSPSTTIFPAYDDSSYSKVSESVRKSDVPSLAVIGRDDGRYNKIILSFEGFVIMNFWNIMYVNGRRQNKPIQSMVANLLQFKTGKFLHKYRKLQDFQMFLVKLQ